MKVVTYTAFALVAFAFNSILARLALRGGEADAAGFTVVRLASGAVVLFAIQYLSGRKSPHSNRGSWISALFLFGYAICFSFAYLGITAATGALVLFGAVQLTMLAAAIYKGERPTSLEWAGLLLAVGGLVHLVLPGLASPPAVSSALMAVAGACWGFYTLRGKSSVDPLADTSGNFLRAIPITAIAALPFLTQLHLSGRGVVLAALSGGLASGVGYTVWYAALKFHTASRAAVLQLAVPVIAAFGGVLLLNESATLRLAVSAALILGGIALSIVGKRLTPSAAFRRD
jgi:drug/metabolite transporter (DMT)-like permease